MRPIYTVGHSTRSIDDFVRLLRAHGIERVVDVRRYPGSRRHPWFAKDALSEQLREAGIAYVHEPDLGGRRQPAADSPNGWWRNAQFRAYADHLATRPFEEALERVVAAAAEGATAIMCAEAPPWRCHRQLIADVLVARGHEVRHILTEHRPGAHVLSEGARVLAGGRVVYPGTDQLDLFGAGRV